MASSTRFRPVPASIWWAHLNLGAEDLESGKWQRVRDPFDKKRQLEYIQCTLMAKDNMADRLCIVSHTEP